MFVQIVPKRIKTNFRSIKSPVITRFLSNAKTDKDFEHWRVMAKLLADTKSDVYGVLNLSKINSLSVKSDDTSEKKAELVKDWNEIHLMARDFGSPEFSDHMSGHVFMQGTPIEDKSSKCVRIADLLDLFTNDEIVQCALCLPDWINNSRDSAILLNLMDKLDKNTCARYADLTKDSRMSAAFAFSYVIFKGKSYNFPILLWKEFHCNVNSLNLNQLVIFLLLSCFTIRTSEHWTTIEKVILRHFDDLTQPEVAVSHGGVNTLSNGKAHLLKDKITKTYGYRL